MERRRFLDVIADSSLLAAPLAVSAQQAEDLKTAKALGPTIPQSLLLRADEVIQ